jgi:hypothetical protein
MRACVDVPFAGMAKWGGIDPDHLSQLRLVDDVAGIPDLLGP